jgi:hypothetical protein
VCNFVLFLLTLLTMERNGTQHDPGGGIEREAKSGGGEMAIDKMAKREPLSGWTGSKNNTGLDSGSNHRCSVV